LLNPIDLPIVPRLSPNYLAILILILMNFQAQIYLIFNNFYIINQNNTKPAWWHLTHWGLSNSTKSAKGVTML
jgi:hypothetical protein